MTWSLVSAEERAKQYPGTFDIPGRRLRASLSVGNSAKLIFEQPDQPAGERMWVEITRCHHDGRYTGRLTSEPVLITIKLGTLVDFGPEHVCGWDP